MESNDLLVEDIASDDEGLQQREEADKLPAQPQSGMLRYTLMKLPPKLALQKIAKTMVLKQSEKYFFLAQFTSVITVSSCHFGTSWY